MKYILAFLFLLPALSVPANNYYVSPAGDNINNGLSTAAPFQTLQYAADLSLPGDTVFAMEGIYTNPVYAGDVLDIYTSGTSDNYIVYKNLPGQLPVIKINKQWDGVLIQGASYIIIDGFTVIGNNDSVSLSYAISQKDSIDNPTTSANGIGIAKEYAHPKNKPHHDIIRNCRVSMCGGGGIYTYNADYITIEDNTVSSCGWYSPYGNSCISLYQNWNSDSSTDIKNYITGNICYQNQNYVPTYNVGSITDGNGIILDDGRNTQNGSTLGVFTGKTYIANNVVFNNGGRGIHCYSSDKAIIVNNTCYKNCQSDIHGGEYTAYETDSVFFINNISFPAAGIPPIDSLGCSHLYVDHNFWAANTTVATPTGANTITGDVNFIDTSSDPGLADFGIKPPSAAINAGTRFYAPATDILGRLRSLGDSVDIGAYVYQAANGIASIKDTLLTIRLFPNPAERIVWLDIHDKTESPVTLLFYNSAGILMKKANVVLEDEPISIDIEGLQTGIYTIAVCENGVMQGMHKFLKR